MKKIVQIAAGSIGGIGRMTRDIHDVLVANGFESYIAYGRGDVFDSKRDIKINSPLGVYADAIQSRLFDNAGFNSTLQTKKLIRHLEEISPDLIHLHNLHGYYINIEVLFDYLKQTRTPVTWTLHDCWAMSGHCVYWESISCLKWQNGCKKCDAFETYPKAWRSNSEENFIKKKTIFTGLEKVTLITPSKWLADLVGKSYLKDYPVKVINNGIDLDVFSKNVSDVVVHIDKKIVLGVASTWVERKGLSDFIKLSAMLPDEYVIVLVGLSDSQMKQLPDNMIGITHTESPMQLVQLYSQAELFLNLTYEDNFPTTNLEAMACGTSVLTYRTGGSPESITTETGYIVEQHDLKTVAEIVANHTKTPDTERACINHAQQYNKKIAFQNYVELYKSILQ